MLRKFILILISSLIFSFQLLGQIDNLKIKYGGVLKIKPFENYFPVVLDPTHPLSLRFISEQLFDNLVTLDKNLNLVPCLAEYWTISDDGRIYTFYLRKGVKFHHEKELTSEDVIFSFKRLISKKSISAYQRFFISKIKGGLEYLSGKTDEIAGLRTKGRYIVEIEWIVPFVSALYMLTMPEWKILPKDLLIKEGEAFFDKPSGTGPFKFDYWIRDTRLNIVGIRLKRNDNYFLGKPYLEAIEFCPFYTLDNFLNKEIDVIPVLSEKVLKGNYPIIGIDLLSFTYLGFSCQRFPFNEKRIRKAFSQVLNKEKLINIFNRIHTIPKITNNYIPPQLPGFLPKNKEKPTNPENAINELKNLELDDLTIIIFIRRDEREFMRKISKVLKDQFKFLNIKLKFKFYNSKKDLLESKEPYLVFVTYDMSFPDPENIVIPLFSSQSNFNLFEFKNEEFEKLIKRAEMEKSWTKRIQIYKKIEKLLEEEVPAIPLYYSQERVAFQNYVRDIDISPLGFGTLNVRKVWLNK
ncbi:ABC transporter substrate-binding protein [Candidatus Aminicenantes bacterium AC-335-A11]|nr:ABC transporter substrate-binding protein [SCandidatus Aminicenantes bacterium Aminicenantia_JdfR_composite]MCP2596964.1 ABC transporter substrate-binding protein [Candidatus Aminicenantes bacterium AC-335-G13]MCP2605944.1 ABC transporter substrate-binding protein [Candidatus Aminicenantes bacterium AC-708-I09]MCP2618283.1 ABC transporter substrate-binding protein [Candidatus Aminicenantes bacterium AC-335-A11]MCP2620388.1 ABC transporter substrate-binding protein [Candidatus Aminicenantes b